MIVRLGRHLILVLAALAILAGAIVAAIAIVRRTVASSELARTVAELLSEELDPETARVRIADVSGNPLSGLVIHDLRIDVRAGGEGAGASGWRPLLIAPRVELRYSPAELVRRTPRLSMLRLVRPAILLPAPGGTWPRAKGRPKAARSSGLGIAIDALRIEDATLAPAPAGPRAAGGDTAAAPFPPLTFSLAADLKAGGGKLAVDIDSLAAAIGDFPAVAARGGIEFDGLKVTLDRLDLRSGLSHAVLSGRYDLVRGADLEIALESLLFSELAAALAVPELARPGWMRGTIALAGPPSHLGATFHGEGTFGPDRITGLTIEARAGASVIEIERLVFAVNGMPLSGAGTIGFGAERAQTRGTLVFEGMNLDEVPFLGELSWMPRGRLSGSVTVGSGHGRRRPFELLVTGGDVGTFALYPGHFRGTLGDDYVIELEEYEIRTRGAVIRGAGTIDPRGDLALTQDLAIDDLVLLGGMFGERRFGGRGNLKLDLDGPVRAPAFTASGRLDSLIAGPFRLARVAVQLENGAIRPHFSCALAATAGGGTLAGRALDSLAVAFTYAGGVVSAREFMAARGGATLLGSGVVEFRTASTRFTVDSLALALKGLHFTNQGPVRIERAGSVWTFEALHLRGEAGELTAQGAIDAAGSATAFELEARALQLGALAAALGGERELGGELDLKLEARGGGSGFELALAAAVDTLTSGRFTAAKLEFDGRLSGPMLEIERCGLDRGGHVAASGTIRFARIPSGFRDIPPLLTREALAAATAELTVSAPQVDLDAWHGLDAALDRASGIVALAAELRGPLAAPGGTLELKSDRLVIADREFAPVQASGRLDSGALVVTASHLGVFGRPLLLSGQTPVRLSLIALPAIDRGAPLDLVADLVDADLAVATLVTDRIAEAEGRVDGQVRFGGTVRAPVMSGAVDVRDGRVVVRGREEIMTQVAAHITFSGQEVHFDELTATDGAKGRLRAQGVLDVTGARLAGYDVTLTLDQYQVGETGAYLATIDGTFTFKKGAVAGIAGLPNYSGTVRVRRLDYLREIVGGGRADEPGPSSWVGRFTLELPRNAWIRNNDLEVELSGDLTYERDVAGRIVLGRLETVRGRYDLVGHTFRITSGEVEFTDPEVIDPEVNVSAETRIPEARIFATITGRASDRQVVLSSDPDYDQATLWRFLVPTDAEQVTSVALTPFMRDLERSLSREIPGLSLRVESRTAEEGAEPIWGARVGTYVAPELFLSAYQGFSSGSAQDVSVEYELSRIAYLKGSVFRSGLTEGRGSTDVDQEYTIDFNLRWEF